MAKRGLKEQLDELVQAILTRPESSFPPPDPRLAALLRIAEELCDLPHPDFKARLKADLERRGSMIQSAVQPIREGFRTMTPYVVVQEATELIDFVKQAFGAEELLRTTGSAGGMHAEVRIGDSIIMIGGGRTWHGKPMPAAIHLYVEDADAVYRRALSAGATSIYQPVDQDYGDREGGVGDFAGNHWYIGTHKATGHLPEGLHSLTPSLHPRGKAQLIDFLKEAFGAEELVRALSPDATIAYAQVRIGDSVLEMGEAHGAFQPMPAMLLLYLSDVDAWYKRAVEAGATSTQEPKNEPYGDRVAAVTDPADNVWYIATPVRDMSQ